MKFSEHVVVLGASPKKDRYSNRAIRALKTNGYNVIPVHPAHEEIEGLPVVHALRDIHQKVHTLTMYVNPAHSSLIAEDILSLNPGRVIFNPGTENGALEERLRERGIDVLEACTLVLLSTGRFEEL